jgi:hypothetical protein
MCVEFWLAKCTKVHRLDHAFIGCVNRSKLLVTKYVVLVHAVQRSVPATWWMERLIVVGSKVVQRV